MIIERLNKMSNSKINLKPQYEGKEKSIIPLQKSKVDKKSEFSTLSKIISESKRIEKSYQL